MTTATATHAPIRNRVLASVLREIPNLSEPVSDDTVTTAYAAEEHADRIRAYLRAFGFTAKVHTEYGKAIVTVPADQFAE